MQNILLTEKGFQSTEQQNHIQTFSQKNKTFRNLVAMAVRVLIPIPFDFLVLCRRSAPLASSKCRVCTLPPVLCTHVGFKKGILYKNVGHLNTLSLKCNSKSGPIAQVLS